MRGQRVAASARLAAPPTPPTPPTPAAPPNTPSTRTLPLERAKKIAVSFCPHKGLTNQTRAL